MVSTYVPFRNGLFLSAAASLALSLDCGYIYYGAHSDDAAGNAYPDCTEHFYKSWAMLSSKDPAKNALRSTIHQP